MKPTVVRTLAAAAVAGVLLAACSTASNGGSNTSTAAATTATSGAGQSTASAAPVSSGSAGSSSGAGADSLAQYTTVPTALPVTTPLSKKPPTGKKVVFLQNGQKPGQQFSAGLHDAAKVLGWTEQDISFDAANPATIGSAFQQAVNGGADVIEVQGLDSALYSRYVPSAIAKKIVVVDTVTSGAEIPGVTYVERATSSGAPQAKIAVAAIMADATKRKVTPHVLNISSVLLLSILTPFNQDIAADLKAADCGSCTSEVFNLSAQASISNTVAAPVVSYLQTHRDINYVVVSNGAFSTGLLPAIKAAGLGDSIKLVGATPLPPQIEDLKAGDPQVLGWIANSIVVVAWDSIDAAARVMVGDDAKVWATVAAPKWLLTKDSGTQLVPSPVAPVDYQQQFKKLWHASA